MHGRDAPPAHARRRRYPGKNPRGFHDKYKELNPEQYPADVQNVLAAGKTPAGMHLPIMVGEVLQCRVARISEDALVSLLESNADEPHSRLIARLLKAQPVETTHAADRLLRAGLVSSP